MSRHVLVSVTLICSACGFIVSTDVGLITLTVGNLLALAQLCWPRPNTDGGGSVAKLWILWACQLMALCGVYMVHYGMKNIVGSGRKYSTRMAVSTLRTIHWAERQCMPHVERACRFSEMNGQTPPKGVTTSLLRPAFRKLFQHDLLGEVARVGQYHYVIYPLQERPQGWVAYAWPAGDQTLQSYCLDDREEILELPVEIVKGRRVGAYVGLKQAPSRRACLGSLHQDPNPPLTPEQREAIAQDRKPPPPVHIGEDQHTWQRWRGKRTRFSKSSR